MLDTIDKETATEKPLNNSVEEKTAASNVENALAVTNEEATQKLPVTIESMTEQTLATEQQVVKDIVAAPNKEELEKQFQLFNMNQVKKNALRIIKLNDLLTKVEDQALERFEKRPDQVSNKELLDYMNAVSNQIEKAQNFSKETLSTEVGGIKIKQEKTEVNINVAPVLNRNEKDRVVDVISVLLNQMKKPQSRANDEVVEVEEAAYVDAETVEQQNPEQKIVYNNNNDDVLNNEEDK